MAKEINSIKKVRSLVQESIQKVLIEQQLNEVHIPNKALIQTLELKKQKEGEDATVSGVKIKDLIWCEIDPTLFFIHKGEEYFDQALDVLDKIEHEWGFADNVKQTKPEMSITEDINNKEEKYFIWRDKTGRGEESDEISASKILATWDISEEDDNGITIEEFVNDCYIDDKWETRTEELECVSIRENSISEGRKANVINPRYTHFAIDKATNKVVTGWDYKSLYDKFDKTYDNDSIKYYSKEDLKDMDVDFKTIKIVTVKGANKLGINPFDEHTWLADKEVNKNQVVESKKSSQKEKFSKVMKEFGKGTLHSGSGKIVKDHKQALAIAYSESGLDESKKNQNESLIKEDVRDDLIKQQIEKDFPGALANYDGKTPYDEYYLQLTNQKKQADKLGAREASKQRTKDRNAAYKAEFGERDKELKKQRIRNNNVELLSDFVDFLPDNLPEYLEKNSERLGGYDSAFYYVMGKYIGRFANFYEENYDKVANLLEKLINDDKYENDFFGLIDSKYGSGVIEW